MNSRRITQTCNNTVIHTRRKVLLARDALLADVRRVLADLLRHISDVWTQVTFTLLFCQRLVYTLLRRGLSGIGDVVELTAKLIEDSAASYIISNGGWVCHDM